MNHVIKNYFRLLETEGLSVNYICLNIKCRLDLITIKKWDKKINLVKTSIIKIKINLPYVTNIFNRLSIWIKLRYKF